jgi:hypothetical protein
VVTCSRWGHLAADGAVLGRRGSRRRCSPRAVSLGLLAGGDLLAAVAGSPLGTWSSTCLALGAGCPRRGRAALGIDPADGALHGRRHRGRRQEEAALRPPAAGSATPPVFCIVAKEQTAKKVLGAGLLVALYK